MFLIKGMTDKKAKKVRNKERGVRQNNERKDGMKEKRETNTFFPI